MAETKYIFVTGGVASSLGKGVISSSIGKLLQARGYNVTIQKFDPYININPGTLNPEEHGECYVTVDGHEADLDLGKISDESPVGKALLGKKVGEVAEAVLPGGDTAKFRVISIG